MPPRFTVVVIAHDTLDRLVMSFLFLAHGAVILLLIAVPAEFKHDYADVHVVEAVLFLNNETLLVRPAVLIGQPCLRRRGICGGRCGGNNPEPHHSGNGGSKITAFLHVSHTSLNKIYKHIYFSIYPLEGI